MHVECFPAARKLAIIIPKVAALGKQYQIEGLLETISLAEEDYLDNLFATSLQSSLLSTEPDIPDNFCATSQQTSNLFSPTEEKATTADVESRVTEESEFPANYTNNIETSAMKEHITQDRHKDTVDTDQDDEMVEEEVERDIDGQKVVRRRRRSRRASWRCSRRRRGRASSR